ncbi:hypothetical protein [Streptomyces sp. NPDC087538]|uniref:hypothetical protein n=1 Tax=unclassified Streptomyces TaxID=2593676 RepID=UPI003812C2BC
MKVLGEDVDTKRCASVYWANVRDSMPDLVQTAGRALRMQPGEGKVASLVVPVLLGPGETADNMLTSRAFGGLAKLLEALRAHDAWAVEQVGAQQQAPSAYKPVQQAAQGQESRGEGNGSGGPPTSTGGAGMKQTETAQSTAPKTGRRTENHPRQGSEGSHQRAALVRPVATELCLAAGSCGMMRAHQYGGTLDHL